MMGGLCVFCLVFYFEAFNSVLITMFLGVKIIWIVNTRVNIYGVAICLFVWVCRVASWAVKESSSDIPEWTSSGKIVLCGARVESRTSCLHSYLLDLFTFYSPGWHQIMILFLGSFCWEFRYAHHAWADGETCIWLVFSSLFWVVLRQDSCSSN